MRIEFTDENWRVWSTDTTFENAVDAQVAVGVGVGAGEDLDEARLAGAVVPDEPDAVALAQREVDVAQGLHHGDLLLADPPAGAAEDGLLQRPVLGVEDRELDGGPPDLDADHLTHTQYATRER